MRQQGTLPRDPNEVAKLVLRIERMQEIERWIQDDPPFAEVIDTSITERLRIQARNQAIVSFIVAVASLIAGWLLNALSPINFIALFHL